MRARIPVLAVFGVFACLLAMLALGGRDGSRATTDLGVDGTAALAGVMSRLGYEVDSLRLGLHVLPRMEPGLLIVASPPGLVTWPPITDSDAAHVLDWVSTGGVVLHLTDRQTALLDALGVEVDGTALPRPTAETRVRTALGTRPSGWTAGGRLTIRGRAGFVDGVQEPLFVLDGVVVASLQRYGDGAVLAVADPSIASNAFIGEAGNLDLLVHAAQIGADGRVLFDDLHAGGGDGHGVVAYARRSGGGGAVLFGVLGLLLLLWRMSARESAVQPQETKAPARGASEYVRGLAGLYERAHLTKHALAVTSRQFRRAVEARAGLSWERDALEEWLVVELGAEAAVEFRQVRSAFAALFQHQTPDTEAVLHAAQLAARFENRWLDRSPVRGSSR